MTFKTTLVAAFLAMPLLCTANAAPAVNVVEGGGAACQVVGGPNTGKSGTYDKEGACCGTWGCTECGGSNAGKCKDGKLKIGPKKTMGQTKMPSKKQ